MLNESKYNIDDAMNRQSRETIPSDEPVFLLRARDAKSVLALALYASLCEDAQHSCAVSERVADFLLWQSLNRKSVKEPTS